jgi:hypothetical protein
MLYFNVVYLVRHLDKIETVSMGTVCFDLLKYLPLPLITQNMTKLLKILILLVHWYVKKILLPQRHNRTNPNNGTGCGRVTEI